LAGALIGPNALGLVKDVHRVEVLAEVGVVLLLFGIGLELSLDRMRRLWRIVVFGGTLQVGVTIAAVSGIALLLGLPLGSAVFLGCVIAVSSTAIVLRGLRIRGEIDAPHGRLTLGILVFQDLCVVPMILIIPILAGTSGPSVENLLPIAKAIGVLVVVLIASRFVSARVLDVIARTRQRDLFVLSVFVICLGTAWVLSRVGMPLALGAFLAGLVVAGSEYRHQALSDLIPFREVLTSLFFVTVGMFLDPLLLGRSIGPIVSLLVAIVLGKFLIVGVVAALMQLPIRAAVLAATALAQVGEFSFVLMSTARGSGLLEDTFMGSLSMAVILSMLVTPIAIAAGPHVAAGVGRLRVLTRLLEVRSAEETPEEFHTMSGHVIVAGYGLTGQELARSLEDLGMLYLIVDLNPENVRQAIQHVMPAYFGDITSPEVLEHLGAARARELAIAINDPGAAERAIKAARQTAPDLFILVRTPYAADIEGLLKAGANEVVSAEIEASAEFASRVLARHRVAVKDIKTQRSRIRQRIDD
jgi:CPA2 family monovalent cation:H+ antiporter-2